jgi:hypothetical protein
MRDAEKYEWNRPEPPGPLWWWEWLALIGGVLGLIVSLVILWWPA